MADKLPPANGSPLPGLRTDSPALASNSGNSTPTRRGSLETTGYLLLTVQHAVVKQAHNGETGTLAQGEMRLECISLPIPAAVGKQTANPFAPSENDPPTPTHDFWLVLNVGTFEMPLIPSQPCTPQPKSVEGVSYSFASQSIPGATTTLTLPIPASDAELEDLDSFEVLLRQYGTLGAEATALADIEAPTGVSPELRGKLVLINEDNGEVVGELDQSIDLVEDKKIGEGSQDRPVVLDFGDVVDGYAPVVKVQTVPEDEMDDWILKGAHYVSKGILGFGSFTSKTIQGGADLFIRNTKATQKPVHFSPRTKAGIRVTHNASVKTVKVAKTTLGKINDTLQNVAEKTYHKTVEPAVDFYKGASEGRRESLGGLIPGTKDGPPLPKFGRVAAAPGTIGGPPLATGAPSLVPASPIRSPRQSFSAESTGAPPGYTGPPLPPRRSPAASPLSPAPGTSGGGGLAGGVGVPGEKPPIPPKLGLNPTAPASAPGTAPPAAVSPAAGSAAKPAIPPKPASLQSPTDHRGEKIPIPSQVDTLLAQENALLSPRTESQAPRIVTSPEPTSPTTTTALASTGPASATTPTSGGKPPPRKRPFFNRLLLAGEVVLTSIEATAHELISSGTNAASSAAEHKFGPEAGKATALLGGSVRNVAVVYIDVRGIGRKALLQGTAKGFVKARLKSGETVQLGGGGTVAPGGAEVGAGEAERTGTGTVVVGMQQVIPTGNEPAQGGSASSSAPAASPSSTARSATAATGPSAGTAQRGGSYGVDEDTLKMIERM